MRGSLKLVAPFVVALALAGCNTGGQSVPAMIGQPTSEARAIPQWQAQNLAHRACPQATAGKVQCQLLILNENSQRRGSSPQLKVSGWGADDIETAYNLPSSSKGLGQIVSVVDAFDNPNVASDLAVYRRYYGLPKAKFYKYNQDGQQSHYPKGNASWASEIDLDVQMVSASCPNCTIHLIEANDDSVYSYDKAVDEAVKLGAHLISNSFECFPLRSGCDERKAFDAPGVLYVVAAGDDGYGLGTPMAYAHVVSVGGTLLSKSGSAYSETVWPDTGGGCAMRITRPAWQHDPGCSGRTTNDIAAVAWNVASYDTYGFGGWTTVGGTSISTPIIAGVFALAGNSATQDGGKSLWTLSDKKRREELHVISSGTDGCPHRLQGSYLCIAGTGEFETYSGPTGWGTPNGIGAF